MTIEQEDTIVHPFILRQFLHNTASRRISQDGDPRSSILVRSVTLISGSRSLRLLTTRENFLAARPTLIISVFFGLTMRPIRIIPVMLLCTSLRTDSGEPPIVASSRYLTFSSDQQEECLPTSHQDNRYMFVHRGHPQHFQGC